MRLDELRVPIVQAPLAGGPSTPELAAAVIGAGAFGFLAAGYQPVEAVCADIAALRDLTDAAYGVNLFVPDVEVEPATYAPYLARLADDASRRGMRVGEASYDDDSYGAKVELCLAERVPVVSFTFGCPHKTVVERLHQAGSEVWVTVTDATEADAAVSVGADVLVAQGIEAGGHRGSHLDRDDREDYGLVALLQLLTHRVDVPLVATGGIATGAGVAAVLTAGARAAQLGTAFLRCPEAGTAEVHREAMTVTGRTRITRAFTGRSARGIENRFLLEHSSAAPVAYPQIHHATSPIRAAGRAGGDRDVVNLWAGQAYPLSQDIPAADLIAKLDRQLSDALTDATRRVRGPDGG